MRTDRAVTRPSSEPVATRLIVDRQTPVKTLPSLAVGNKIVHYNKAHSLVAKTQYFITFDKQVKTKISERFGEFEYHCFDPYHKWFNIIESSKYPAFYSPSKMS